MVRHRLVVAIGTALALLLAACAGSAGAKGQATTTSLPTTFPTTTTTTTTLAPTNDPAFFTRTKGVLTVATDNPVPPWFEKGGIDFTNGFEYDVARLIAYRLGLGAVRVVSGNVFAIEQHIDCRCDLFLGQVRISDALARAVDLSVPYIEGGHAVLVRAGTPPVTIDSARAMRWAVVYDDEEAGKTIEQSVKPGGITSTMASADSAVEAVASGQVDAALLDTPIALAAAARDSRTAVAGRLGPIGGWAAVLPLGSANTPSLNKVIEALNDGHELGFLARRYLGTDPTSVPVISP